MKSWKTTVGGALVALSAILSPVLPPEYSWVGPALLGIGGLILGGNARDNKVTSEEVAAKK
jgi:hypothetical protein